jgi:hypothetical protein
MPESMSSNGTEIQLLPGSFKGVFQSTLPITNTAMIMDISPIYI